VTDAYERPLTAADVAVGDEGPVVEVADLEPLDFVKYAGASGDFARIHVDKDYVRERDNPDVWGHGMLADGFIAHMVADWFGVTNITSMNVRFESRYWPGDTITAISEVTDVERNANGADVTAEVHARTQDGDIVVSGTVGARLPAED